MKFFELLLLFLWWIKEELNNLKALEGLLHSALKYWESERKSEGTSGSSFSSSTAFTDMYKIKQKKQLAARRSTKTTFCVKPICKNNIDFFNREWTISAQECSSSDLAAFCCVSRIYSVSTKHRKEIKDPLETPWAITKVSSWRNAVSEFGWILCKCSLPFDGAVGCSDQLKVMWETHGRTCW